MQGLVRVGAYGERRDEQCGVAIIRVKSDGRTAVYIVFERADVGLPKQDIR
jgi:hypothetical protein